MRIIFVEMSFLILKATHIEVTNDYVLLNSAEKIASPENRNKDSSTPQKRLTKLTSKIRYWLDTYPYLGAGDELRWLW